MDKQGRVKDTLGNLALILRNDPDTGRLASATPVWWEYHLHQRDGEVLTDFSWSELSRFLEA